MRQTTPPQSFNLEVNFEFKFKLSLINCSIVFISLYSISHNNDLKTI